MSNIDRFIQLAVRLLGMILVCGLLLGCQVELGGKKDKKGDEPPAAAPIAVQPVERGNISSYLCLNAILEAEREVDAFAQTFGKIIELTVEEGDRVSSGQLLARLEDAEQSLTVERARAALEQEQSTLQRAEGLYSRNLMSEDNYERIKLSVRNAELTLQETELALTYTQIFSPLTGIVAQRFVDLGDRIDQSRPLFKLVDRRTLRLNTWVSEVDLCNLRIGQKVSIVSTANSEEQFTAKLIRISPIVDPTYGKVKVTFKVSNPSGTIRPGQYVELKLTLDTHENVILTPKKALVFEAGQSIVYVVKDSLAHRRPIRTGLTSGNIIEILSGIAEGDSVIVEGQATLKDSSRVKVVSPIG
ncbi:MAG: efflux RND transporter periplasmic adaptor subunit [Candidatus Electryoneaceae bacterium]|nr:efflux RND transporter periplasmic adaptor subunit [Candidatus Electryoneaceae bacterium]